MGCNRHQSWCILSLKSLLTIQECHVPPPQPVNEQLLGFSKPDSTVPRKKQTSGYSELKSSDLAYQWLEIRVEQHVSIGVNGKVVAIWSKLQEKGNIEGDISENKNWETLVQNPVFMCVVCALTVKRGVSLLISSRETSMAITPKMSWFWDFWEKTMGGGKEEVRGRKSHCKTHLCVLLFFLDESFSTVHSEWFQGNGVQ